MLSFDALTCTAITLTLSSECHRFLTAKFGLLAKQTYVLIMLDQLIFAFLPDMMALFSSFDHVPNLRIGFTWLRHRLLHCAAVLVCILHAIRLLDNFGRTRYNWSSLLSSSGVHLIFFFALSPPPPPPPSTGAVNRICHLFEHCSAVRLMCVPRICQLSNTSGIVQSFRK